jgi:hypothetical protein
MTETQILFVLVALAVLAYYTDLFGWDPNERHGSATRGGVAPALLILVVGLALALHFDLITQDTLTGEFAHASATASRLWDDVGSETAATASERIGDVVDRVASSVAALAHEISQAWVGLAGAAADAPGPAPAPRA